MINKYFNFQVFDEFQWYIQRDFSSFMKEETSALRFNGCQRDCKDL